MSIVLRAKVAFLSTMLLVLFLAIVDAFVDFRLVRLILHSNLSFMMLVVFFVLAPVLNKVLRLR